MSVRDQFWFDEASCCYLCEGPFSDDSDEPMERKVADHCHFTGRFRGPAHSGCNIQLKIDKENFEIPVVMHNFRGYDSHFVLQGIKSGESVTCVPTNEEKYLSVKIGKHIKFIDSLQFLPSSLENLVESLAASHSKAGGCNEKPFRACRDEFGSEHLGLVLRKGVYPYEFSDSEEKFKQTTLPPKRQFYSSLRRDSITDEQYELAQNIWKTFKIKNFGQYHDHYLKQDVCQLADVFEHFRSLVREVDRLEALHYLTLPQLCWDSALKKTKVELELLTDPAMYSFVESGMRGGVSVITHRAATMRNPYIGTAPCEAAKITANGGTFDYGLYLDANNLYGWAMSQCLPLGGFRWLSAGEINKIDLTSYTDRSETSAILEVDLQYPADIHDEHEQLPVAPEHIRVHQDMLSKTQMRLLYKSGTKRKANGDRKLIPNLYDKDMYITHVRNLKLYLELGLKLKKIHRVIEFEQEAWLAPYIAMNTDLRTQAVTKFEKDFFKLRNNSVFGKCMENVRNRQKIDLATTRSKFLKLAAKPTFRSFKIFHENLVGVSRHQALIRMCKPISVGFCVLELSKWLMFDFYYRKFRPLFPDTHQLLFTDTDSLAFRIRHNDVYKVMARNLSLFDTSDYPHGHFLFSNKNKKVAGKFTDELTGKPLTDYIGLRSKMYAFKCGEDEKKVAKGIGKATVKADISFQQYAETLNKQRHTTVQMQSIRSDLHRLYSVETTKIGLSCFDDKRYILPDGVSTLPHGHYRIPEKRRKAFIRAPETATNLLWSRTANTKYVLQSTTPMIAHERLRQESVNIAIDNRPVPDGCADQGFLQNERYGTVRDDEVCSFLRQFLQQAYFRSVFAFKGDFIFLADVTHIS
jgi:hypothetical protein